jgi:hypothetical protein
MSVTALDAISYTEAAGEKFPPIRIFGRPFALAA